MYGEYVRTIYGLTVFEVFVFCCPNTPKSEKQSRAHSLLLQWLDGDKEINVRRV